MKHLGHRLRSIRKSYRISQLDLEINANLSIGTISRIEKGKCNPTKETLFKIASVLNLKTEEIIELFCIDQIVNSKY